MKVTHLTFEELLDVYNWNAEKLTKELKIAQKWITALNKAEIENAIRACKNLKEELIFEFDLEEAEIQEKPFPRSGETDGTDIAEFLVFQIGEWCEIWDLVVQEFLQSTEKMEKDELLDTLFQATKTTAKDNKKVLSFLGEEILERVGNSPLTTILMSESLKRLTCLCCAAVCLLNEDGEGIVKALTSEPDPKKIPKQIL